MRLHFLASTLIRGGAETMAGALSLGMQGRGHDVRWTLLRQPGEIGDALDEQMEVVAGMAPERYPWTRVPALARRLRGSDALYALDHQNAVVLAAMAAPLARVRRRVVAIHTTGQWGGKPSLGRPFRSVLGAYDAVLALSPDHADYLADREHVSRSKIRLVPNGIDLTRFDSLPDQTTARRSLGIPARVPVVGTVAMMRPEKNLELLLEAAASLIEQFPDLHVVLIGDGPERTKLENLARAGRLADRVRFLGRRTDIPLLLPALDVFVLPSHPSVETQPVAVIEAQAAGIPVVATRVGDLEGLLEGGEAGLLVPAGESDSLASAIQRLLDGNELRSQLITRGRSVARRFSLEASVDALSRVLEETR